MKKFLILSLTTMLCAMTAWGDVVEVGNSAALREALNNGAAISAGTVRVVKLTEDITESEDLVVDLTLAKNSSKSGITFDLNGHTLDADIYLKGPSNQNYDSLCIKNGTFIGKLALQSGSAQLSLKKGTNDLDGSIEICSGANNTNVWGTRALMTTFGSGDEIKADFVLDLPTTWNFIVNAGVTLSGDVTLKNKACIQIRGSHSGDLSMADNWTGEVDLYGTIKDAPLTFKSGTFYLCTNYAGNLTFNGGTFSLYNAIYTGAVTFPANNTTTLKVSGTSSFYNPTSQTGEPATYTLTAGKVKSEYANNVELPYFASDNGDGSHTINSYTLVNVTKGFGLTGTDFMALYNDSRTANGDSLRLFDNCTLSGTINLNKAVKVSAQSDYRGKISLAADAEVTFSNAGQTFYGLVDVVSGSTANFNAGTYKKIDANGNITVDGANVTLNSANIASGNTLTLNSGTINYSSSINLSGTMNIHGGVLNVSSITSAANTAKLYMDGGLANFTAGGIRGHNYAFDVLSLTGGAINNSGQTSSEYAAIYLMYRGTTTTIENVTINSVASAIRIDGGWGSYEDLAEDAESYISKPLSISNCNINVSGDYSQTSSNYFNRSSFAMIFNAGIVTLSNNTVTSVKSVVMTNNNDPYVQVIFASGSYETTGTDSIIVAQTNNPETFSIPGTSTARFSKKPVVYIPSFGPGNGMVVEVAEAGYTMNNNGGWWEITEADPIALIGTSTYVRKMSDILNYFIHEGWSTNINIQFLKDYTLTVNSPLYIDAGYTCNLDLNGHVLTVNGRSADKLIVNGTLNIDGTDSGSKIISKKGNGFKVNEGGELSINGGTYKTTQQQAENITYSNDVTQIQISSSYIVRNNGGTVKLTDATFDAGCYAVDNRAGEVTIKGGEYSSSASIATGEYLSFVERYHHYGYAIANAGTMSLINATVTGVHGAVICKDEKGVLEIDGCELITENSEDLEDANGALVVATNSMVTVKNTKMKSPRTNYATHVGDIDAGKTFGIINMYAGCYLTDKMYVEQATASAGELLFPMSVSENSAWYEVAQTGGYGPLPAGYEYAAVNNSGDDATNYAAGYRWKVVIEGEKDVDGVKPSEVAAQDEDPTYTIPWQKESTWVGDDVPEENTIVTIPVDAVVVVSNSESETEAVAEQVFVSTDATLKVEEGTTLTVGDGGINIANGGQIIVEKGAVVKVGAAGLITTEEDALVIESSEDEQGVFMLDPEVTENTQPKASVKIYTNSKQTSENPWEYTYQRIALPIYELGSAPANDFAGSLFGSETVFENYLFYWNTNNKAWENCLWTAMVPFKGYQLANNSAAGRVTYTFTGNLIGNNNGAYEFSTTGFDFFGNSYTAPIYLKNFLEGFANAGVEAAVWIYDYAGGNYITATPDDFEDDAWPLYLDGVTPFTEIPSMEGFILNLRNSSAGNTAAIDYTSSIWNNPRFHAPARKHAATDSNTDRIIISVKAADGKADMLKLNQGAQYSEAFDNGADASKYFAENGINLYATTANGDLSRVATSDLNNTLIGFRSNEATSYTLTIAQQQGEALVLRDKVTNATIEMTAGATYTFTQEANTTNPARFEVIRSHKVPTSVDTIENAEKTTGIYSITGQYVGENFTTLPAGVYIVNGIKVIK